MGTVLITAGFAVVVPVLEGWCRRPSPSLNVERGLLVVDLPDDVSMKLEADEVLLSLPGLCVDGSLLVVESMP